MKNYENASEELVKLFNSVLAETSIPTWVEFELRCDNKQKKISNPVKLNDLVYSLTENLNFAIVVNETAFDQLSDEQKRIELRECIEGVSVGETDKVSYEKPNFVTYDGLLAKYGYEKIKGLYETRKAIFVKIKEEEDLLKAQLKGKRGKNRQNAAAAI